MYISQENPIQVHKRLAVVLKSAKFKLFERPYFFKEFSSPNHETFKNCLAMVRDEEVWSYLVPAERAETENFTIFSFHFKDGLDNSGFVGWLATKIKYRFGSGVFVICGQNSINGGIFDYWGCPISIGQEVVEL